MRIARSLVALCLSALIGCGGGPATSDAGASMDSPASDGWPEAPDARVGEDATGPGEDATDGTEDATNGEDAPRRDDARVEVDTGIDCSTIGCGAPPVCGEACDAPCGCCPCAEGEVVDRGGTAYVCTGGCYAPRGGESGDPCSGSAECGPGLSCCYPCGIPGCMNVCEPSCAEGTPGCAGGCLLRA